MTYRRFAWTKLAIFIVLGACSTQSDNLESKSQLGTSCVAGLPCGPGSIPVGFTPKPASFFIYDPLFVDQRNLARMQINQAWGSNPQIDPTTLGPTSTYTPLPNSRSTLGDPYQLVAILDTGFGYKGDPDLNDIAPRIIGGYDFIDSDLSGDGNGPDSDYTSLDTTCPDLTGTTQPWDVKALHGSQMASILLSPINGVGMVGVLPFGYGLALRVLSDQSCTPATSYAGLSDAYINSLTPDTYKNRIAGYKATGLKLWKGVIDAIRYAADYAIDDGSGTGKKRRVSVMTMAFGGTLYQDFSGTVASNPCTLIPGLQDAIDYAYNKGITVVASAGNADMSYTQRVPAGCKHIVVASAVYQDGTLVSSTAFSRPGDWSKDNIHIAVDVADTHMWFPGLGARNAGASFAQTSGAAVIAAGVIGMIKSFAPGIDFTTLQHVLIDSGTLHTNTDMQPCTRLLSTGVKDVYEVNTKTIKYCGQSILNAKTAIDAALNPAALKPR